MKGLFKPIISQNIPFPSQQLWENLLLDLFMEHRELRIANVIVRFATKLHRNYPAFLRNFSVSRVSIFNIS